MSKNSTLGRKNALVKLSKVGGEAEKLAPEINHAAHFYTAGNYVYSSKMSVHAELY